jgi:hypothetical protein
LANQSVNLSGTDVFGNPVNLNTTTNGSWAYLFDNLMPGNYTVSYTNWVSNLNPLASFTWSVWAGNKTIQSINNIRLNSDVAATNYDFSLEWIPSTIAGQIYLDANLSKTNNSSEVWLAGFTVTLTGINILGDNVVLTTTVDSNGKYIFTGLADWVYSVSYNNNSIYISEVANTGTINGQTIWNINNLTSMSNIRIFYWQDSINNDFWLIQVSSLGGTVYQDLDKSKTNNSEPWLDNQTVYLNWVDVLWNNVNLNTTTDSNGQYLFASLVPGTYSVSYANNHGDLSPFGSSPWSVGWSSNGYQVINWVDLGNNIDAVNYNFGLIETIYRQTIAGNIYIDEDMNNIMGGSDLKYISWAIIILSGTDLSGNLVSLSTVAWTNWAYKFTNLQEGIYDVYLDTSSVAGYIHHIANDWTIDNQNTWNINNLKIETINLWFEKDGIEYNFWLTHMDLTTNIMCSPKQWKAWDFVSCTITYSNEWITDSNNTVIDLISTAGLIINPSDVTKNIWTLTPGQNWSYTITVQIVNDPNIILNTLNITSHIYSTSTPELDILTNYSSDSIFVLPEDLFTIGGNVYDDQNADNYKSIYDLIYTAWSMIQLNGTDRFWRPVSANYTPLSDGKYIFTWLIAGNYNLSITNISSLFTSTSSNAGTISWSMVWVWYTENMSWNSITTKNINNIHLLSDGINYNFWVAKVPDAPRVEETIDIVDVKWGTYNTTEITETFKVIENTEIIDWIKEAKESNIKLRKTEKINANNIPKDIVFHSLPASWVEINKYI